MAGTQVYSQPLVFRRFALNHLGSALSGFCLSLSSSESSGRKPRGSVTCAVTGIILVGARLDIHGYVGCVCDDSRFIYKFLGRHTEMKSLSLGMQKILCEILQASDCKGVGIGSILGDDTFDTLQSFPSFSCIASLFPKETSQTKNST